MTKPIAIADGRLQFYPGDRPIQCSVCTSMCGKLDAQADGRPAPIPETVISMKCKTCRAWRHMTVGRPYYLAA